MNFSITIKIKNLYLSPEASDSIQEKLEQQLPHMEKDHELEVVFVEGWADVFVKEWTTENYFHLEEEIVFRLTEKSKLQINNFC